MFAAHQTFEKNKKFPSQFKMSAWAWLRGYIPLVEFSSAYWHGNFQRKMQDWNYDGPVPLADRLNADVHMQSSAHSYLSLREPSSGPFDKFERIYDCTENDKSW